MSENNSEQSKTETPKTSLGSLFLIVFIDLIGLGMVIPILPIIFYEKNFFPSSVPGTVINLLLGLLIASYPISQFFAAPILGKLSDRHGRKKILILSLIGTFIGYVMFAIGLMINNIYVLFASRILDGITGGNISIVNSAIADISDAKNKTKNFGLIGMAFGLGFILGPFLGGVLSNSSVVSWFSLATPFWFAAGLVIINLLFIIYRFQETLKEKIHKKIHPFSAILDIKKIFGMKQLGIVFLVLFLIMFGWTFFTQFFQVFLYDRFSFNTAQIGYLFAYMGLWIAIAQGGIIRPVSERFKPEQVLRIAIILTSGVLLTFLLPERNWVLYIIMPFLAIFFGFIQPNMSTIISNAASPQMQGEVLGLRQSVVSLAQAITPVLAGLSLSISTIMPIVISSSIIFIAWIIYLINFKKIEDSV